MSQRTTLVGSKSAKWVVDQVDARQTLLGKASLGVPYTNDELRYINGKTTFMRLTSGCQISNNVPQGFDIPTRLQSLGLNDDYLGNGLARNFILEGGVTSAENGFEPKSGITPFLTATDNLGDYAYGFASDPQYGYSPPPGIISANVKSLNRGSLKSASIKIKCWNPRQFNIIDTLFMKLKGGMLFEWGHSIYVNNEGEIVNNNFSVAQRYLESDSQDEIYSAIQRAREKSHGNYDGMLAYLKNFKWDLQSDNSYDIDLSLISLGDVVESLKTDVTVGDLSPNLEYPQKIAQHLGFSNINRGKKIGDENVKENPNTIIRNVNRSILDQFIAGLSANMLVNTHQATLTFNKVSDVMNITPEQAKEDLLRQEMNAIGFGSRDGFLSTGWFKNLKPQATKNFANAPGLDWSTIEGDLDTKTICNREICLGSQRYFDGEIAQTRDTYMRLGTLLRFVESYFVPRDTKGNTQMFTCNHNFYTHPDQIPREGKYKNQKVAICYTMPPATSLNPEVAMIDIPTSQKDIEIFLLDAIKKDINDQGGDYSDFESKARNRIQYNLQKKFAWMGPFNSYSLDKYIRDERQEDINGYNFQLNFGGAGFKHPTEPFIGYTNYIYVNCDFISKTITSLISNKGGEKGISIYSFLTQILKGVQEALGGINDFELVYDSETNHFSIMDNTQIPGADKILGDEEKDSKFTRKPLNFNINLFTPGVGSFVTKTGINSQISKNLANEIAISAFPPKGGNRPDGNANSMRFAWLNYGREEDRLVKAQSIGDQPGEESSEAREEPDFSATIDKYAETLENYANYLQKVSNGAYNPEKDLEKVQSVKEIFSCAIQGYENATAHKKGGGNQSRGFIPIGLSLTLEGLSGPRIYEKISINDTFLPASYKKNVYFIIKGISHSISDGKWETKYDTFCVPFSDKDQKEVEMGIEVQIIDFPKPTPTPDPLPEPSADADDYKSLVSGLPHGRPNYAVDGYRYALGGSGDKAGDGDTIFKERIVKEKQQIVIHHTAGHPKIGQEGTIKTAQGWSGRDDNVSTAAVISYDGIVDLLYPDEKQGNHTGAGNNWLNLGIEIQSLGYCYEEGGKVISSAAKKALPFWDGATNEGYTAAVDRFGNPTPWKGRLYHQAYSMDQVNATIQIIRRWIDLYQIPYTYDYYQLFPSKEDGSSGGKIYNIWKNGTAGVYTHNSMKGSGKSDIFPQREMLIALRDLALSLKAANKPGCNGDVTDYGQSGQNFDPFGSFKDASGTIIPTPLKI